MLDLVGAEAGGSRPGLAAKGPLSIHALRRIQARLPGFGRGNRAFGCYILAGVVCLALCCAFLSPATEDSTALFKRSEAFVQACEVAGAEITALRRASFLVDDCSRPIVTPVLGEEGRLIIRRTLQGHVNDGDGEPTTYSLMMDGRGFDNWRVLQVKRAPGQLTLDVSLLLATRSAMPPPAQR